MTDQSRLTVVFVAAMVAISMVGMAAPVGANDTSNVHAVNDHGSGDPWLFLFPQPMS
jgi:hypothetical protein